MTAELQDLNVKLLNHQSTSRVLAIVNIPEVVCKCYSQLSVRTNLKKKKSKTILKTAIKPEFISSADLNHNYNPELNKAIPFHNLDSN